MPKKEKVPSNPPSPDITGRKQIKYALREAFEANLWGANI